jgi:hypothetical protein
LKRCSGLLNRGSRRVACRGSHFPDRHWPWCISRHFTL